MAAPKTKAQAVDHLVASAQLSAQSMADRLLASAQEEALRLTRAGWEPDEIEDALKIHLGELSDADITRTASKEVNEGFSLGRVTAINKDEIEMAIYSAILDNNCCSVCEALDGEEFVVDSPEYDENMPPNANCEGGDQCRCTYLYVLKDTGASLRDVTPRNAPHDITDKRLRDTVQLRDGSVCQAGSRETANLADGGDGQLGVVVKPTVKAGPLTPRDSVVDVVSLRANDKMVGADTNLIVAGVSDNFAGGDRSIHQTPRHAMGVFGSAQDRKHPVTVGVGGTQPDPAAIGASNLTPKVFGDVTNRGGHKARIVAKLRLDDTFDESKHPRDAHGRWGAGAGPEVPKPSERSAGLVAALASSEKDIKDKKLEFARIFDADGNRLATLGGDASDHVKIPGEGQNYKDAILTHNHPSGNGLSLQDGITGVSRGFKEMRAVTPSGDVFSVRRGDKWPSDFEHNLQSTHQAVMAEFGKAIKDGRMTVPEANRQHYAKVYEDMGRKYPGITVSHEVGKYQ